MRGRSRAARKAALLPGAGITGSAGQKRGAAGPASTEEGHEMADAMLWLGAGLAVGLAALAVAKTAPSPGGQMPAVPELPDPFLFRDGSRVRTRSDWARRRKE